MSTMTETRSRSASMLRAPHSLVTQANTHLRDISSLTQRFWLEPGLIAGRERP
jgi:hypothetical protein